MAVPHKAPLSRWLTLLVVGTAVPLLAFALVVLVWLVDGYRADQERRHTDTTRALALAVDAEIRSWKTALQALAGSHELQAGRLAGFYEEAQAVAARYEGWITLTEASGQQQMNTRRLFGAPLPKAGTPETVQAVFRSRQPVVTDLVFGAVAQRYIVAVMIPVMREGQVLYTLDLAFAPERLTRLLADQQFPAPWVVAITDGQQKVIARVPERPDRLGQPVLAAFAQAFAGQTSGTVEATTTDGRIGRSTFQRLREAPWTVNVMVPVTELQAAWRRPVLAFLLLGGLAACGAVGLAVFLARKIARPVTEAAQLAAAVIYGEAPVLLPSRIAEVADLQQALAEGAETVRTALAGREQALTALQEANETLEQRVTERTSALRDSEARFRALAGATFEGIAMAAEGRYLDANEQWCRLLGYSREELIGRELIADVATEDRDRVLQSIREGGASHFEHAMVRKDGTRMLVEVRGRTVQYQNRLVRVAAIRDVTDRHQAEAALRLSEEKFAKAFAANPAAMALTRITDGRILDTNGACLAVLGYAREELIGRSTTEAGVWCDPGARSRYVEALYRHAPVRDWEVQFATKTGQLIEVLLSGELITVRGEEVILSTFLDITARKQAEAALRLSEQKFAKAFAANPAAIALTRLADGRFFDVNDTYLGITGFRRDEVIGRTAGELGAWPNADSRSRFVAALRQQGAIRGWEERFCKKSGEQLVALLSAEVITVAGEDLVLSTYLDITARKQAEEALQQAHATLEQRVQERTAELAAAVERLEWEVGQRQQAEAHLQRTNRVLRLLSACNEALVRLEDEPALTREICRIAVEIGGYRMAWVGMAEADADRTVRPVAAIGCEEGYLESAHISWADVPRGQGPTGTAIRTGTVQIGDDFLTEARLAPWRAEALARGFRSSIALPLGGGGRPFGALTLYATEPRAFQQDEIPILQDLADDLAFGIGAARVRKALRESGDRLRVLTGDLAMAEQRERQRLGQVLHDGLQQFLVAARMNVDLVARRAPDELRASCQQVYTLLGDAITASRALTAELSPPMLHSAGFVPALEWLARWMGDTHHLAVTLHTDAAITVEDETAKVLLFQAVRELLFNAVKHAGVPDATVEVRRHGDTLTIVVADQGAGFDPERAHATGGTGLGLPAVRQRLEYLGGNLVTASAPGQGSRFTLSIPLPPG